METPRRGVEENEDERSSTRVEESHVQVPTVPTYGTACNDTSVCLNPPRFDADVEGRPGLEARAALYVPLNHQGRLLGMVQLFNRTPHGAFSQPDADLAVYVGRQLSEFLHNARIRPADVACHADGAVA